MSFQRLQDTDAYILMEFVEACKHLVGVTVTKGVQSEMALRARPYLVRLLNNGNSMFDCEQLMREAIQMSKVPKKVYETA